MVLLQNALTVDVEDYYHVSAFEPYLERAHWERQESRVVASTHRVLELLEKHDVRATFFVLGWVAEISRTWSATSAGKDMNSAATVTRTA